MVLPRGGPSLQLAPDGWTQHLCAHFLRLASRGKGSSLGLGKVPSDNPTLRQLWGAGEEIPISFAFLSILSCFTPAFDTWKAVTLSTTPVAPPGLVRTLIHSSQPHP